MPFAILPFGIAMFVAASAIPSAAQDLQIAGKIAFVTNRDGNDEIYLINADSSGAMRLTYDPAREDWPQISPDGTRVVFVSARDGNDEIYVMNVDGTGQTRLTTDSGVDGTPAWSPDGTKIAFTSNRSGANRIWVMDADGDSQTQLSSGHGVDVNWGPDGRLTFVSGRSGHNEIWTMNADGSSEAFLVDVGGNEGGPAWSPDGSKVAFFVGFPGNLYVVNAGDSSLSNLGDGRYPRWSTTGTKLVFQRGTDLYVMNADGSGEELVTGSLNAGAGQPWWDNVRHIGSTSTSLFVSRTMTVENPGNATLSVSNITSTDGQFTISPTNFNVPPGDSQDVEITFTPTSEGTHYSTLTITSNDLDAPTAKLIVNGTATAAPTFGEVGGSVGVADTGDGTGVAWGDYDNDGYLDLYLANNGANRLYQNNGDGTFTEVGTSAGVADTGNGKGVSWGDYDNDGDLDLYLSNIGGNRLYQNEGNGTFAEVGFSAGVDDGGNGYGVSWVDYDRDGDLDLYLANNGTNRLYQNEGNGTFAEVGFSAGVDDGGFGRGGAWGDYDEDGDQDLYVVPTKHSICCYYLS